MMKSHASRALKHVQFTNIRIMEVQDFGDISIDIISVIRFLPEDERRNSIY